MSLLVIAGGTAYAQSSTVTAGAVAAICRQDPSACRATAQGFLAGYRAGVQKGVRSTFEHDALTLETTRGRDDTYERYRQIVDASSCGLEQTAPDAAAAAFLRYLERDPNTRDEPFADVMEAALEAQGACRAPALPGAPYASQ